jgi:uncharacterized membrane protein
MSAWIPVVRAVHIFCGMIALFVAPCAMLTVKGELAHRRWGKIYFWMMAVVAATAIVLAFYRPILFLALIAVFSFYFAFRGYRSVLRKRGPASPADWIGASIALAGSVGLIGFGIHPLPGVFAPPPIVSISLGLIGLWIPVIDMRAFLHPPADRNAWWFSHMGGMLGSYIATVSAFSVVNFHFLPAAVRWLWPVAIGIPGIFIWIGYYRRKFNSTKTRPAAANA